MKDTESPWSIVDSADSLERQNEKLRLIADVLMRRVEQDTDTSDHSYAQFQATIALEAQVRARTKDLAEALEHLNAANAELGKAKAQAERARNDLSDALEAVHEGFGLFDNEDRLVKKNSRFCAFLPDIEERLQPGISFSEYVALIAKSTNMVFASAQDKSAWEAKRAKAHRRRHINFIVELQNDRWVQVSEQRTPGNGTAILQTDVTDIIKAERQEAGKALDDQAKLIRKTLDHVNEGVAIFDEQQRLLRANSRLSEILSPPVKLLMRGTRFSAFADYFNTKHVFRNNEKLLRLRDWTNGTRSKAITLHLSTIDDHFFDLHAESIPEQGFVISLNDVTVERRAATALREMNETLESRVAARTAELKSARDEAEAANDSKSRFVAAVTHDLLQPMNAAKLFLAALSEYRLPDAPGKLIGNIATAFEGAEAILGALLDITRLERDDIEIHQSPVALKPVLETLRAEYAPLAKSKSLQFDVEVPDVSVTSDPTYLRRIMQNLIGNAIRYTQLGRVHIAVEPTGDGKARIDVVDTGPGIPKEQQSEVFKEFRKLATGTAEVGSMGLGLAIVRRACDLLGHKLEMDSSQGTGTRFSLWLPITTTPKNSVHAGPTTPSSSRDLAGLVVLVVENDGDELAAITGLLDQWGIHSIESTNATHAADLIEEIGIVPDAILTDYHLDGTTTGLCLIKDLRTRFGKLPGCVVTANHGAALEQRARRENAELLLKPVAPHQLRSFLTWAKQPEP